MGMYIGFAFCDLHPLYMKVAFISWESEMKTELYTMAEIIRLELLVVWPFYTSFFPAFFEPLPYR